MSTAYECDRCHALFKTVGGCLTLDVSLDEGVRSGEGEPQFSSWSDINLCFQCSQPILSALSGVLEQ